MLRATQQQVEVLAAGNGKARVTRQLVEVLAAGTGKMRVARQIVEVLAAVVAPSVEVDATSTLSLTHAAGADLIRLAASTLSLTQTAVYDVIKLVADTLSLIQVAAENIDRERLAIHGLSLIDEAVVAAVSRVRGVGLLVVEDVAVGEVIKPVQHTLLLTHLATTDLIRSVSNTLASTQEARVVVVNARSVLDTLTIEQQATYLAEFARGVENTLSLLQEVVVDHCHTVTTTIELTDEADAELIRVASDDLILEHSVGSNWVFIRRRTDNLTLTHAANNAAVRPRGSVSLLDLTQAASVVASKSIVDALTLTQIAFVDNIRSVLSTLALSDLATVVNVRLSAEDDLLDLTDEAIVGFVKQVHAANTLQLTELAGSGFKVGLATSVLQETDYTFDPDTWEAIPYYIGLQDVATAVVIRNTPYVVSDIISFAEHAVGIVVHADAIDVAAIDALSLTHAAYVNAVPVAAHTLILTDLAAVVLSKAVSDTLLLTDIATLNVYRATLAVIDTLVLEQSIAVVGGISSLTLYQYHPFVGEGAAGNPTPPPVLLTGPLSSIEAPFQLIYPAEGEVTDSVTLRAPELGNKDRLSFNRVIRETRGGTLIVFADPIWPKIQTLALSFTGLRRSEAQDLLDFFDAYLGLEIGMIDWEQRYWVGVITTPEEPIIEDVFNSYSVKFEFEGELDPTWLPQVIP